MADIIKKGKRQDGSNKKAQLFCRNFIKKTVVEPSEMESEKIARHADDTIEYTGWYTKGFAVESQYSNFYAGGDVVWSENGELMYCLNNTEICVVSVATGLVLHVYGTNAGSMTTTPGVGMHIKQSDELEDPIYCFTLAPDNALLVTAHRSGLLRLWSVETHKVVKLWKSQHRGPVVKIKFSPCGMLICSSGADSVLRIWDYVHNSCVCVLRDYSGPALVIAFHPEAARNELYAVGANNTIYCWNYKEKQLLCELRGHLSQVTALCFHNSADNDCGFLTSVSRDKVLIAWRLADASQYKVVPMYEELEGVCNLPSNEARKQNTSMNVIVACANGSLKVVDCASAKISTLNQDTDQEIRQLHFCERTEQLAVVTLEHNILIYKASSERINSRNLECTKQLIGFNDEILDLCFFGVNDRFLAMATNSKNIKVYDTTAHMNCKIISGHKDTVMTLSTVAGSNLLLSAGKDLSICIWELNPDDFKINCIARSNDSHTSTIGCISFGFNTTSLCASVSQDGSLKVWNLKKSKETYSFNVRYAALAHDKEVNSVTFSPNNKFVATASQDKTAKVWSAETQTLIGILRGHTRGVWCVRFSPVDQVILTTSGDCSLRLWALNCLTCLKRFEQECTVLRAEFIHYGKYIVSVSTDGLLKVWSIKTNTCVQTLDAHTDRIWALAVSANSGKNFYSGGADSKLVKWKDITEECVNEEIDKRQELVQQEQILQSLLHQKKNMQKAFKLALKLGKPRTTYNIVSEYVRQHDMEPVKQVISELNVDQRTTLMEHTKAWTTNSRHCKIANLVLNYLLSDCILKQEARVPGMANVVEVLTPYLQRHYKRVNELKKELMFLEYIVNSI